MISENQQNHEIFLTNSSIFDNLGQNYSHVDEILWVNIICSIKYMHLFEYVHIIIRSLFSSLTKEQIYL